jgi:flavin-binding protein dodecin
MRADMSDHVYKTVEITGSSPDVISDAIRAAVDKASQTLRNLEWFEVVNIRGMIEEGSVAYFQVTVKLGFRLE